MALINCPECSKEISDKVKNCPHCGYPLIEDVGDTQKVEVTSVNLKMEEGKKKKIHTTIISILVVAAIAFGGFYLLSTQKTAEYAKNVDIVTSTMLSSSSSAEDLLNLTAKVWYNTIYEKYDSQTDMYTRKNGYWESDFNVSLGYLFADSSTKTTVDNIKSSQEQVADIMKKLQNPPEDYKTSYATILDLYSAYQGLTDLAVNPTGSFTTFGSSKSEKTDKFIELYKKLQTQLPDRNKSS